ncbi:hypothetical protein [Micromonospora sp. KC723]|uniref:hypothetical protein n=1 Tax=Micromonospora sp. KC723 TaxID=2530381 RepID=UPI001405583A|nr:hypothetical protein [Micromonospora sp. KC723]
MRVWSGRTTFGHLSPLTGRWRRGSCRNATRRQHVSPTRAAVTSISAPRRNNARARAAVDT